MIDKVPQEGDTVYVFDADGSVRETTIALVGDGFEGEFNVTTDDDEDLTVSWSEENNRWEDMISYLEDESL